MKKGVKKLYENGIIRVLFLLMVLFSISIFVSACGKLSFSAGEPMKPCCQVKDSTNNLIGCKGPSDEASCLSSFSSMGWTGEYHPEGSCKTQCDARQNECIGFNVEYGGVYTIQSINNHICSNDLTKSLICTGFDRTNEIVCEGTCNPSTGTCGGAVADCTNKCEGWSDGAGGVCPNNNGALCGILNEQCFGNKCISPTLVLYYKFDDGTATDLSINGNHGTIYGNPTFLPTGGISKTGAFKFDGVNDYINLNSITEIPPSRKNITIAAWINITSIPTGTNSYKAISRWDGYVSNRKFDWLISINSTPAINFHDIMTTNEVFMAGSNPISTNKWYHIVAVYANGIDMKLYINGEYITNGIYQGWNAINSGTQVTIGAGQNSVNREGFFKGIIDEIKIYNSTLSASEVRQLCQKNDPGGLCFYYSCETDLDCPPNYSCDISIHRCLGNI